MERVLESLRRHVDEYRLETLEMVPWLLGDILETSLTEKGKSQFDTCFVGRQVPDADAATSFFRRSSEKGHMDALYNLGMVLLGWDGSVESELGVLDAHAALDEDYEDEAAESQAARRNKALRVRRDERKKALQFFSLAAQNGHVRALHKVGRMCFDPRVSCVKFGETKSKRKGFERPVSHRYSRALGAPRSCDVAVNAYKTVAERGPRRARRTAKT